jgi:hypothetical protein
MTDGRTNLMPKVTITLTREQQLEVLAATGLQVTQLEVELESLAEGGEATAALSLPEWIARSLIPEREEASTE